MSHVRIAWGLPARFLIMLLLILTSASLSPSALAQDDEATPPAADEDTAGAPNELTVPEVVDLVLPGTVQIMAYNPGDNGYNIGSGFVYSEDGIIITNWHVVTGSSNYVVTYTDGSYVEAELVGLDARDDIAVLSVDPDTIPAVLPMGDSNAIVPGETVIAIGSPSGITNTITTGVATGANRTGAEFGLYDQKLCQNYNNLVQHSAAINGGNSGGPLFNMRGEVIGINTVVPVDGETGVALFDISYAVASNTIVKRAEDLIEDGELSIPVVGIQSVPLTVNDAVLLDLPISNGVVVTAVFDPSPAEEAGIEENWIILAIDDRDITKEDTMSEILFDYDPGDTITLSVLTDSGDEEEVDLTLGEASQASLEQCEDQEAPE
jgi:S1-C subfamily serine protease